MIELVFWLLLDGQKSAQRLSKQLKTATNGIRRRIDLYNSKSQETESSAETRLPSSIAVDQALDASFDIDLCIQSSILVI
jgi:hypothetical protein